MAALGVLIVDDNWLFLEAARDRLEREGLRVVVVAATSAEALRRAEELRPEVVLVRVPGKGRPRPRHHDAAAEQPTASLQTIQHTGWADWTLMNAIHDALRRDLDQLTRATAERGVKPDRLSG